MNKPSRGRRSARPVRRNFTVREQLLGKLGPDGYSRLLQSLMGTTARQGRRRRLVEWAEDYPFGSADYPTDVGLSWAGDFDIDLVPWHGRDSRLDFPYQVATLPAASTAYVLEAL